MTDHGVDPRVDKFLRYQCALLGVGLVIFAHQLELHIAPADFDLGGIGIFNRKTGAVFVVFADRGLRPGQW